MKFSYDPDVDAFNLRLSDARIDDIDEVAPGIIVDYDEDGQVIGIEMLDVRKHTHVEVQLRNLPASRLQADREVVRLQAGNISHESVA